MKFFILGALLICSQLVGAGGPGGAGAADVEVEYVAPCAERVRAAMASQQELDRFVAERAIYIYGELNSGRFRYHEMDEWLSTPSVLWRATREIKLDPYTGRRLGIIQKLNAHPHIAPSIAVMQLFRKGGVIECSLALDLVRSLILLDVLGDEIFDNVLFDTVITLPSGQSGIRDARKNTPLFPGEFGYITNAELYRLLHPGGIAVGQNVFCVATNDDGEPLYLGFGTFFATPKTEGEVLEDLYTEIMKPTSIARMQAAQSTFTREIWNTNRREHQYEFTTSSFDYQELATVYEIRMNIEREKEDDLRKLLELIERAHVRTIC